MGPLQGNAIERLGKNVIGLRTALLHESIFPFICFGYGCDFAASSSILDRVSTIAMFGKLNVTHLHNTGYDGQFNRGSFYFREDRWTVEEMSSILYDIAERSIYYYYSKYGKEAFCHLHKNVHRGAATMKVDVIVERAGQNWCAYTPDDFGVVVATGQSREETIENFRAALRTHLEVMREGGLPTPEVAALEIRETMALAV